MLAACGGGGATTGTQKNCPQSIIVDSLVYPAPGSTGIPDATQVVFVSGAVNQVTLRPTLGPTTVTTLQISVPSPLPLPNAARALEGETAFALPTLAAATTYTVIAEFTSPRPTLPVQHPATDRIVHDAVDPTACAAGGFFRGALRALILRAVREDQGRRFALFDDFLVDDALFHALHRR